MALKVMLPDRIAQLNCYGLGMFETIVLSFTKLNHLFWLLYPTPKRKMVSYEEQVFNIKFYSAFFYRFKNNLITSSQILLILRQKLSHV